MQTDPIDRRLTVALVVLFAAAVAFPWAVRATGSWWWLLGMVAVVAGVVVVLTALGARDSGSTFAVEFRRATAGFVHRSK